MPFVRPKPLVARVALATALALVALPGIAGSRTPEPVRPLDPSAFRPLAAQDATVPIGPDSRYRSESLVVPGSTFVEPGMDAAVQARPGSAAAPAVAAGYLLRRAPRTLSGWASFYDNGTTAMRLPRGTLVVICGAGGCIERTITDYGPNAAAHPERIADLDRADFFAICGCPSFSGTTRVTVRIY